MLPDILSGLNCQHLIGQSHEIIASTSIPDTDQVNMAIDQTGQDSRVAVIDLVYRRAFRCLHRLSGSDLPDGVASEQNRSLFSHRPAVAIN